ncbi:class I SAM-dependent methyltransferase [Roseibium sp.]|uniref:class I SAM-dependent methyltransferase n=1 Tax=Roseibium sp. TaxID=1936156 RepID=UPI003B5219CF
MSLHSEAYQQNYLHFRSLNQIMWQIPVLAMTLTGGLWFGVSRITENPLLVTALLSTATLGNLIFLAVLFRFRHVMGCYLAWLKEADESSFVDASANSNATGRLEKFCNKDKTVRSLFSIMLFWASACSAILLVGYWYDRLGSNDMRQTPTAIEFYERHAATLADRYEAVAFEKAYPFLVNQLSKGDLKIADIGAGTGRDAAWLAKHGHSVTAVEPSEAMRKIAKELHPSDKIAWVAAGLPRLDHPMIQKDQFDFVLVNAVWMHIAPTDRAASLQRLKEIISPTGAVIVSLRLGPADPERDMHRVDPSEFALLAKDAGFNVIPRGDFDDILGRPEVSWKVFELSANK